MVNVNADVFGIIFPNSYDSLIPELVSERLMASIPFAGRYRIVDFLLSSMVNAGIGNVAMIARKNYHSLMDHLGSGSEWDLARKNGGLHIIPPYSEKTVQLYTGRIEALASILGLLRSQKERYVILSDANLAANFDFRGLLERHIESGADVTLAYKRMEIPEELRKIDIGNNNLYYTLGIKDNKVTDIAINPKGTGEQNFCLNIYVVEREMLIEQISDAYVHGHTHFERDFLAPNIDRLHVEAFEFTGYVAYFASLKSYFDENLKMLDERNVDALFGASAIYTKIRDDNPTRYLEGARVKNVMAADGCVVEGEVENSILFRGVRIGKGAKVKNCVLMQDTVIGDGVRAEYVITDKNVTVTEQKALTGTDTFPVYIAKRKRV